MPPNMKAEVYYWIQKKTDIHWHLLNIYQDQAVDVSAVKKWVKHFSFQVKVMWKISQVQHSYQLMSFNQLISINCKHLTMSLLLYLSKSGTKNLFNDVIMFLVFVIVSMKINKRHYLLMLVPYIRKVRQDIIDNIPSICRKAYKGKSVVCFNVWLKEHM